MPYKASHTKKSFSILIPMPHKASLKIQKTSDISFDPRNCKMIFAETKATKATFKRTNSLGCWKHYTHCRP